MNPPIGNKLGKAQREYYQRNKNEPWFKEQASKYNKKKYVEMKTDINAWDAEKQRNKDRSAKWRAENPELQCLRNVSQRAKKLGVPFNLTMEDIVFPEICPILGIPLYKTVGTKTHNTPTVDRIDPLKGYTKENIKIISHKANTWKSNMTIEDVKLILNYMEKHGDV